LLSSREAETPQLFHQETVLHSDDLVCPIERFLSMPGCVHVAGASKVPSWLCVDPIIARFAMMSTWTWGVVAKVYRCEGVQPDYLLFTTRNLMIALTPSV
jgi:hypothetical protein